MKEKSFSKMQQKFLNMILKIYFINSNVMWEIGYAAGLKKPILCIINDNVTKGDLDSSKLPFDISTTSTIVYSFKTKEDEAKSIKDILKTMKSDLLGLEIE